MSSRPGYPNFCFLLTTFFTSDIIKSELLINNLSFSLNNYFSCKLSFVGKSYKIKKKINRLYLNLINLMWNVLFEEIFF